MMLSWMMVNGVGDDVVVSGDVVIGGDVVVGGDGGAGGDVVVGCDGGVGNQSDSKSKEVEHFVGQSIISKSFFSSPRFISLSISFQAGDEAKKRE